MYAIKETTRHVRAFTTRTLNNCESLEQAQQCIGNLLDFHFQYGLGKDFPFSEEQWLNDDAQEGQITLDAERSSHKKGYLVFKGEKITLWYGKQNEKKPTGQHTITYQIIKH